MQYQTPIDLRLKTAVAWCQCTAVFVLVLGLIGGIGIYYFSPTRDQWFGWLVGTFYVSLASGLLVLGELMRSGRQWATTLALVGYCLVELFLVVDVIALIAQSQICPAVMAALFAVGVVFTIINVAGGYGASSEEYVHRPFKRPLTKPNDQTAPQSPSDGSDLTFLADNAETANVSPSNASELTFLADEDPNKPGTMG